MTCKDGRIRYVYALDLNRNGRFLIWSDVLFEGGRRIYRQLSGSRLSYRQMMEADYVLSRVSPGPFVVAKCHDPRLFDQLVDLRPTISWKPSGPVPGIGHGFIDLDLPEDLFWLRMVFG